MFTAMILICASGVVKTPDTCFTYVHENLFATRHECKTEIANALKNYPFIFEFYDEEKDVHWKVSDLECVDWNALKV